MELKSKRTVYDFENQSENMRSSGEATYDEWHGVIIVSAEVSNLDGISLGTFYYLENLDGKINKSIDNVNKIYMEAVEELMSYTVAQFKEELNKG